MHNTGTYFAVLLLAAGLTASTVHADSTRAECGFTTTIDTPRNETSACTFSQRQGYIRIAIDGGPEFDLRPVGDTPGNYIDADGNAIYRRSNLGEQGLIFQLPDRFLSVYWNLYTQNCDAESLVSPQGCRLIVDDIAFTVQTSDAGSINQMTVQTVGPGLDIQQFTHELDGNAQRAEIADLDANGWPEIYIYISSAGSGSYGSLVAYAVNNGKSITPIYLPPLTDNPEASAGYLGHDEFAVIENRLIQRFPIYLEGDTNSNPTGGTRQLQYKLVPGEAGWILETERIMEY